MKKPLFILMAISLCIGTALASDVGKLQTNINPTVTVELQHAFIMPAFAMATVQVAPVVLVTVDRIPVYNEKIVRLNVPPTYANPDYGSCRLENSVRTIQFNRTALKNGYAKTYIPTARHVIV